EARMRAKSQLVLRFSLSSDTAAKAKQQLAEKYDCVLSSWSESADAKTDGRVFVVAYCQRSRLYTIVKFLKSSGAAGIIVDRGEFIFEGASPAFGSFRQMLKSRGAAAAKTAEAH
ncbi:MAG: hypothetical protein ACRECE_10785, partial [Xanthobacteraceae bacterium]